MLDAVLDILFVWVVRESSAELPCSVKAVPAAESAPLSELEGNIMIASMLLLVK
jgi:hypothetical protein